MSRVLGALVLLAALGLAFPVATGLALGALLRAMGVGRNNKGGG